MTNQHEISTTTIHPEQGKPFNLGVPASTSADEDLTKRLLIEQYNYLNDQIITNEQAFEDSTSYLKKIPKHDEPSNLELRSQIEELHTYINAAKLKIDKAVAAVVAHRWHSKGTEFQLLLENMTVTSKPDAEKFFHEECSNIAIQLAEKDKIHSTLHLRSKVVDDGPRYSGRVLECNESLNNRGDLSKYDIELAAKTLLDSECDEILMRLLRASRRIYLHTKEILVLK